MDLINILIVEDEIILRMDLAYRLTQMGYKVVGEADNGQRALALFQELPIDLVLLDIHIKGEWDGVETARRMRTHKHTPLIFLTGMTDAQTIERARSVAPSAYITKPFNDLNLRIAIDLAVHNFIVQQGVASDTELQSPGQPETGTAPTEPADLPKGEAIMYFGEYIFVKQNYRFVKFRLADILFLRSDGNYTDIVTQTHKYTLRLVLNKVLEKIQNGRITPSDIVRIHRGYAVNLRQIDSFCDNEVFVGPHTLPVGRSYREQFIKAFEFR